MAWSVRLTKDQAMQLNDKAVEMILSDEDPGQILRMLDDAIILEEE